MLTYSTLVGWDPLSLEARKAVLLYAACLTPPAFGAQAFGKRPTNLHVRNFTGWRL